MAFINTCCRSWNQLIIFVVSATLAEIVDFVLSCRLNDY